MAQRAAHRHESQLALRGLLVCGVFMLSLVCPCTLAADQTLRNALEHVRDEFAVDIVYSATVVPAELTVALEQPSPSTVEASLKQLLAPHALSAIASENVWFIVRNEPAAIELTVLIIVRDETSRERVVGARLVPESGALVITPLAAGAFQGAALEGRYALRFSAPGYATQTLKLDIADHAKVLPITVTARGETTLERLVVSTSRYGVIKTPVRAAALSADTLQVMPKVGDDPLRLVRRLPGAASGGLSARVHLRGGNEDETALVLDGLTLVDPFHLRDYQSVFSAIDRRVLSNVDVYTGAFPATFGDSLSGVIEMRTVEPATFEHELAASFFHLSAFSSGTFAKASGDYVLSMRRGNLNWVLDQINDTFGDPDYRDFFGRVRWSGDERLNVSLNIHRSVDNVSVIPEVLPEERVEAFSDARNTHLWATAQQQWTANLYAQTILSYTAIDNDRRGSSNETDEVVGQVFDERRRQTLTLKQDWTWRAGASSQWRFGGRISDSSARYRYASSRQFFELAAQLADDDSLVERTINQDVEGHEIGAYFSTRFVPAERLVVESGLRWDRQTYTDDDAQWSPRINLMFNQTPQRRLRLSAGRFHQSQAIHALQVEDGLTRFNRAQRADQWVLGVEQDIDQRWQIRLELYNKRLTRPATRFENQFDPLVVLPELAVDRVRIDPSSGRLRGAELSVRSISRSPLSWWFSYAISDATDRIDGRDVPRSWDQRHALSGGIAWQGSKWEVSLASLYRSGWPTTGVVLDDAGRLRPTARNEQRLGAFQTVDLHVARHFDVGRNRVTLTADLINSLDRANPCCVGYDVDDDIVIREVDHWLPLIPSLGFRVSF